VAENWEQKPYIKP